MRSHRIFASNRSRGLAFLEALLFVPVWALLLVGLFHVTRVGKTLLVLRSEARACAHRIALRGCDEIPEECRAEEATNDESSEARAASEKAKSRLRTTSVSAPTNDPVESALETLGGKRILVSRKSPLKVPKLLGAGEAKLSRTLRMPCAPKLKTPEDSAFGTMGLVGGGF